MEEVFKVINKKGQDVLRIITSDKDSRIRKSKAYEVLKKIHPKEYSNLKIIRVVNIS